MSGILSLFFARVVITFNHFTINGLGTDNILIVGSGTGHNIVEGRAVTLKPGQTSSMFMMESFLITTSTGEQRSVYHPILANLVSNWRIIGSGTNGTIQGWG
jgi:hypothetical protein